MPYEKSWDVVKGLRAAQPSPPSRPPQPPNAPRERLPRALSDPSVMKPSLWPCIYSPNIPRVVASSGHEMLVAKGKAVKQWGCQVGPAVGAFFYRDISNRRVTTRQHSKRADSLSAGSNGLTRDYHSFQPLVCASTRLPRQGQPNSAWPLCDRCGLTRVLPDFPRQFTAHTPPTTASPAPVTGQCRGARRQGDKTTWNLIKAIADSKGNICGPTASTLATERLSLPSYLSLSADSWQSLGDLLRLNT